MTDRTQRGILTLTALAALGLALYNQVGKQNLRTELDRSHARQTELQISVTQLESKLAAATRPLDDSNASARPPAASPLAGRANAAASAQTDVPVTKSMVDARYKNARALAKAGEYAKALSEFLWCYDDGMVRIAAYSGVRQSFLLSEIFALSRSYPPALDALKARRDDAQLMLTSIPDDFEAAMSLASINTALGESGRTLALFDQLPSDSPARQTLAPLIYNELAAACRYEEAAQAKPYRQMVSLFESIAEPHRSAITGPHAEKILAENRTHATRLGVGFVEVLTGAGQLDDARDLATLVMAYNQSPETKTALQSAATKAGHPDLFAPAGSR